MNQRRNRSAATGLAIQPGGDADLAVRLGDGAIQPEVTRGTGYPEDEQGLGLDRAQRAQREAAAVQDLAAAARP